LTGKRRIASNSVAQLRLAHCIASRGIAGSHHVRYSRAPACACAATARGLDRAQGAFRLVAAMACCVIALLLMRARTHILLQQGHQKVDLHATRSSAGAFPARSAPFAWADRIRRPSRPDQELQSTACAGQFQSAAANTGPHLRRRTAAPFVSPWRPAAPATRRTARRLPGRQQQLHRQEKGTRR
jgi:hypothetical protein